MSWSQDAVLSATAAEKDRGGLHQQLQGALTRSQDAALRATAAEKDRDSMVEATKRQLAQVEEEREASVREALYSAEEAKRRADIAEK